jgi:DNA-binding MarR family transcriptional regulator
MTNVSNPATPALNGQVIGQTQHAIQAVLDSVLVETDTSFHQWVLIRQVALSGGSIPRAELVDALTDGLKIETAVAVGVLDDVVGRGLVHARGVVVVLTETGHDRYQRIANDGAQITVRLYGDLPPEDLETTRRVLTIIRERANAELARA